MSLFPSENHTLIIQTFAKKDLEPWEIKINVTEGNIHTVNTVHFQLKMLLAAERSRQKTTLKYKPY